MILVIVPVLLLLSFLPPEHGARRASGELTVTATVASSASVTFAADGTPMIVVANAPADAQEIARATSKPRENKARQSEVKKKKLRKGR